MNDIRQGIRYISNFAKSDSRKPLLVCLHGNSSCAETFSHIIENVSTSLQVLACDLPGCGRHSVRLASYSMQAVGKLVSQFIKSFSYSDLYVLGHSLGGHLIAYLTVPVFGMLLCGTPPLSSAADFSRAFTPGPEAIELLPLLSKQEPFTLEEATKFVSHTGVRGKMLDLMINRAMETDGKFREGCLSTLADVDQLSQIQARQGDVVIFHALRDSVVSRDYLESVAKHCLWRGKLIDVDGPHMLPVTHWKEMLGVIEDYIGERSPFYTECEKHRLYVGSDYTATSNIVMFKLEDGVLRFSYYDIDVTLKVSIIGTDLEVSVSFSLDPSNYPPNTYMSIWIGDNYENGPTVCWKIRDGLCSETWKGAVPFTREIGFFVYC